MQEKEREAKRAKYKGELIDYIKKNKIMRQAHIHWDALSFSLSTAKSYKLLHDDDVEEALANNRKAAINYMLAKWINSDNATLQIAAMKIIADDETFNRLEQRKLDVTTDGEKINDNKTIIMVTSDKTREQLNKLMSGATDNNESV